MGSGEYPISWLKTERVQWHADKYSGKGDGPLKADEMVKVIQRLIEGP
jgi:hypothetical protein